MNITQRCSTYQQTDGLLTGTAEINGQRAKVNTCLFFLHPKVHNLKLLETESNKSSQPEALFFFIFWKLGTNLHARLNRMDRRRLRREADWQLRDGVSVLMYLRCFSSLSTWSWRDEVMSVSGLWDDKRHKKHVSLYNWQKKAVVCTDILKGRTDREKKAQSTLRFPRGWHWSLNRRTVYHVLSSQRGRLV